MFFNGCLRLKGLFYHQRTSLALCLLLGSLPQSSQASETYDQMIVQARSGNSSPVLDWLAKEAERRPLTRGELADWLQIAGWANQDRRVVDIWQRYQASGPLPVRAKVAVARAYRNLKEWNTSLLLWHEALRVEPDNDDLNSGLSLTMTI